MKTHSAVLVRWRCLALLSVAMLQLCAGAALPAPPEPSSGGPSPGNSQQTNLDLATPPPITEDELHMMVEQLLMEAYGDEYEPPPPRLTGHPTSTSQPSSSIPPALGASSLGSSSLPSLKFPVFGSTAATATLLGSASMHSQLQDLINIQPQPKSSKSVSSLVRSDQVTAPALIDPVARPPSEAPLAVARLPAVAPPAVTPPPVVRTQGPHGPVLISDQKTSETQKINTANSLEQISTQRTVGPIRLTPPLVRLQTSKPAPSPPPSPAPSPPPAPSHSSPPPQSTVAKKRHRPGIPTREELREALLFEQANQPKILIVDRRTKKDNKKNEGTTTTTTQESTDLITTTRIPAKTPPTRVPRNPVTDPSTDTTQAAIMRLLSSRNSRASNPQPAAEPSADRAAPVVESARLLSHIVSEDNKPFKPVDVGRGKAILGGTQGQAPQPFTLPNLGHQSGLLGARTLDDDYDDDEKLLLQMLADHRSRTANQANQANQFITPAVQLGRESNFNSNNNQNNNNQQILKTSSTPGVFGNNNRVVIDLANFGNGGGGSGLSNVGVPLPPTNLGAGFLGDNGLGSKAVGSSGRNPFPSPVRVSASDENNIPKFTNDNTFANTVNSVNSFSNTKDSSRLTVGDLVMSLDGQNGIRVLSLGDLRNQAASPSQQTATIDSNLLQQLMNAMISENVKNMRAEQLTGLVPINVGVPLSMTNQKQTSTATASGDNQGRGLGSLFGFGQSDEDNNNNNDVGIINDLIFDASLSVGGGGSPSSSVPQSGHAGNLDGFFVDNPQGITGIGSEVGSVGVPLPSTLTGQQDPFPATFDTSSSFSDTASVSVDTTTEAPLTDNTDFDFTSYEDDYDPLPVQPPNVFRTGVSDIFFTKGQWVGTLLGGLFDVGSAMGESVSKLFKKNRDDN